MPDVDRSIKSQSRLTFVCEVKNIPKIKLVKRGSVTNLMRRNKLVLITVDQIMRCCQNSTGWSPAMRSASLVK